MQPKEGVGKLLENVEGGTVGVQLTMELATVPLPAPARAPQAGSRARRTDNTSAGGEGDQAASRSAGCSSRGHRTLTLLEPSGR